MEVEYAVSEFGPILAQRPYLGRKAEPVTAHIARVLVTSKGEHRIHWPHDRAHSVVWQHTRSAKLLRGRVKTVYDIDLGVRHLMFDVELPGAGDTFSFKSSVTVEWRVLDPSLVVRSQLHDIRPLIQPVITEEMRRIARQYDVEQSAGAERAINERLVGEALDFNDPEQLNAALERTVSTGHVGREYGLWTRTTASVQPDRSRLEQSDELRGLKYQIEAERLKQELRILQERNSQEVLVNRSDFYRQAITSGDIERAVLEVAQNPEDLTAVMQVVRDQEMAGQRMTIDFVNKLLDTGAIERWQVNDQAKAALEWLQQSTNAVFTPPNSGGSADVTGQRKRIRKNPYSVLDAANPAGDTTVISGDTTADGDR